MADELALGGLRIEHGSDTLLDGVALCARAGRVTGLVGPSGSGKSLTLRAALGLVDLHPGLCAGVVRLTAGALVIEPTLEPAGPRRERAFGPLRQRVSYVQQDAAASLDPLRRVGAQLAALRRPTGAPVDEALQRAGFTVPDARDVMASYPHQLSGGMAQRVALAAAWVRGASMLLADEPTTGLDAEVQRQVLADLRAQADAGMGVLIVSHDLRWLTRLADEVTVLDGGRMVERWEGAPPHRASSEAGQRLLDAERARPAAFS